MRIESLVLWHDDGPSRRCPFDDHVSTAKRGDTVYSLNVGGNPRIGTIVCAQCGARVLAAQRKLALLDEPRRSILNGEARGAVAFELEHDRFAGALRAWLKVIEDG